MTLNPTIHELKEAQIIQATQRPCTMGTTSFPEVKRPGRGADNPPPSSTEAASEFEL